MDDVAALDAVVCEAASVRVVELEAHGRIVVDLSRSDDRERLRAAMTVSSLPGYVCACRGQVRFEFFDADGARLAVVAFHHGISLAWSEWQGHGELADGTRLERWLDERRLSAQWRDLQQERLDWIRAVPPALEELGGQLLRSPERAALVTRARRLMLAVEPVSRVLQLLAWCAAGTGWVAGYPPHEAVAGRILDHEPVARIVAALQDPRAGERHVAGAARYFLVPPRLSA
ncbi:hypothetical protein BBK82_17295 [Lentzea guizhouensis]|uniref:Uncharacterized protein n=1 Tax=Lentzea guizhouensis TaxID=1586287 RepID=A0A1B2HIJ2_9PSEU|nr:hypothetical protein [Lentzea guizhouensis]ANZ37545.1 hypothetical protein BBK82_17295 [Lentzea guizhouensis]